VAQSYSQLYKKMITPILFDQKNEYYNNQVN